MAEPEVKMNFSKDYQCHISQDIVVPKCIRDRKDMNWSMKYFLSEVIVIDEQTSGKFYCKLDDLAKQFFVTKPTAQRWLKDLMQLGLIELVGVVDKEEKFHRVIKPVLFRIFSQE